MFPHTVTVYNFHSEETPASGFQRTTASYITVLRGVFLETSKARSVGQSGAEGADTATLYIPFSAPAVDGVTGMTQRHVNPPMFRRAEDKAALWTLSTGGECFFVKGEAVHPDWDIQRIEAAYGDVYRVTRVDEKDFGGDMAHWEVGGA